MLTCQVHRKIVAGSSVESVFCFLYSFPFPFVLFGLNISFWNLGVFFPVNFQMFKLVLEKAEERETKLPTSTGSLRKQESSRKTSTSALLTMPKLLTMWITTNCGKLFKRWEYQTNLPPEKSVCRSRSNS